MAESPGSRQNDCMRTGALLSSGGHGTDVLRQVYSEHQGEAEDARVASSTEADLRSWDVEQVVQFVTSIPGCGEYAEVGSRDRPY